MAEVYIVTYYIIYHIISYHIIFIESLKDYGEGNPPSEQNFKRHSLLFTVPAKENVLR
jgi:hypothetical protein